MSRYTDFMKKMLPSAKGASQKEKFRWVAAQWKRQKGKGDGLHMAGRGMKPKLSDTYNKQENMSKWSDYGDVPGVSGEGVKRRRGGIIGPRGCNVDDGLDSPMLGYNRAKRPGPVGCKVPMMTPTEMRFANKLGSQKVARGGRVNTLRQRHNQGAGLFGAAGKAVWDKVNGRGLMGAAGKAAWDKMRGGALSGIISAKQKAALAKLIKHGGKVNTQKGVLADLLKGLDISIN